MLVSTFSNQQLSISGTRIHDYTRIQIDLTPQIGVRKDKLTHEKKETNPKDPKAGSTDHLYRSAGDGNGSRGRTQVLLSL